MTQRDQSTPAPGFQTLILLTVGLLAWFALSIWMIEINRQSPDAGPANTQSLQAYWSAAAAVWVALSVITWQLSQSKPQGRNTIALGTLILVVALAARVAVWCSGTPQLSDDLWRYIHDGRTLASGINPYAQPPSASITESASDPILQRVNHPHLTTIYQLTSQVVFALLWWVHPDRLDPLAVYTFTAGFIIFDLLTVLLLLIRLAQIRKSLWWATLYAWHPLAISEIAASGHQDTIGIALMLAALVLIDPRNNRARHCVASGVLFAAAVAVKPIVLLLALPIAWSLRGSRSTLFRAGAAATITGIALYAPFLFMEGGLTGLFETVQVFVNHWSFNSSLYTPLLALTGSKTITAIITSAVLLIVVLGCMLRRTDLWSASSVIMFAALLLTSTAYPWYLLWALVFIPIQFNAAIWVLSLTIGWSYAVFGRIEPWRVPLWIILAEYLPVYALIIAQWVRSMREPTTPAA